MEWPSKIEEIIINDIINFDNKLNNDTAIVDTIIAYNSLTIQYVYLEDFNQTVIQLKELYSAEGKHEQQQQQRVWEVPVCYDIEFGLDLKELALAKGMSLEEVVKLHTKESYLVYFLGFQPGFLYLGGLDKKIHMSRKATPRLRVQKGSVGIGGEQTGVYPSANSGGWNIIGKSPVNFFDILKEQPCFAKAGDRIQFFSITKNQFHHIVEKVKNKTYELKFQLL